MEATTGELSLEEDDPETVERMLHFLYLGVYNDGSGVSEQRPFSSFVASSASVKMPSPNRFYCL